MASKSKKPKIVWHFRPGLFGGGNYILEVEDGDFAVSYNPQPTGFGGIMGGIFGSDDGAPETALIKDEHYYILNGDFRRDYERLIPKGFDACLTFFRKNEAKHRSSWSTTERLSA